MAICGPTTAVTTLLLKETDKLSMGEELVVTTPHSMRMRLQRVSEPWTGNTYLTLYQVLRIRFLSGVLNLASFCPDPEELPAHDCAQGIDHLQYGQLNL